MVPVAAGVAAAMLAAGTAADPPLIPQVRRVCITVVAPPDTTRTLLDATLAEADAIWRPAGVVLAWRRVPGAAAVEPARRTELTVTVEDHRASPTREGQTALGWIHFAAGAPDAAIHLSRANAEALIDKTASLRDRPAVLQETLLGRALGRALAHELGHYLFQSPAHAGVGLMRAVRPATDFFSPGRSGFEITITDRAWLAAHAPARGE
jgi:hypothetical protein